MKRFLYIALLYITLSGCITTQPIGLQDVIEKNKQSFVQSNNNDIHSVAAILKEFSNMIEKEDLQNIEQLIRLKETYMENLISNHISSNYPVKASRKERKTSQKLINDTIMYIQEKNIPIEKSRYYINLSSSTFVKEVIYHGEIH